MTFALIGNQNCGKTTLFNQLTGSNQHVGNFPGRDGGEEGGHHREAKGRCGGGSAGHLLPLPLYHRRRSSPGISC